MAQPPEITARGAQPYVRPHSPPLNLHDKASNDLEEGANILGGRDAPLKTTAVSATQASADIRPQDRNYYRPLSLAAQRGDWKSAKNFIDRDPHALTARITDKLGTALLVAAKSCRWEFVLKLLELLSPESVAMKNRFGATALHYVAQAGTLKTAKALVEKNANLLRMVNNEGSIPLHSSIMSENKELVWYFALETRVEYRLLSKILRSLNQTGLLDVSLYFFRKHPGLVLDNEVALLFWLASKPSHFFSGSSLGFFKRWIYTLVPVNVGEIPGSIEGSPALQPRSFVAQAFQRFNRFLWKAIAQLAPSIKIVQDMKLKHECALELVNLVCEQLSSKSLRQISDFLENPKPIMSTAVVNGIEEIVRTLLQYFPDLIDHHVATKRNLLQAAIEDRQEKIVNIIKDISPIATKNLCKKVRESKNTTLHLVGKLAPVFKLGLVSGAALQMQRELQWFKEVEKITLPNQRELKNSNKETAKDVFWEAHKGLAMEGEKWMKDTANSCMLVSTLIDRPRF